MKPINLKDFDALYGSLWNESMQDVARFREEIRQAVRSGERDAIKNVKPALKYSPYCHIVTEEEGFKELNRDSNTIETLRNTSYWWNGDTLDEETVEWLRGKGVDV